MWSRVVGPAEKSSCRQLIPINSGLSSAAHCINGHLLRTGQEVYARYHLAPPRWSCRSDSQRQGLITAVADDASTKRPRQVAHNMGFEGEAGYR